jgi:hypothetical protein
LSREIKVQEIASVRTLPIEECRRWIARSDYTLNENLYLRWPDGLGITSLYAVTDRYCLSYPELCRRFMDWLPAGRDRLLIVADWIDYIPDKRLIFEAIRRISADVRPLVEEPGHLFTSSKDESTWYDDRPETDVVEETIAMWLFALMLQWGWAGCLHARDCSDALFIGSGYVEFVSRDSRRLEEAKALADEHGISTTTKFPWGG